MNASHSMHCRRKMKVSAFSKIEMSPLEFDLGVFNESGAIAYEQAGTVTNGSNAPIGQLEKPRNFAKLVLSPPSCVE